MKDIKGKNTKDQSNPREANSHCRGTFSSTVIKKVSAAPKGRLWVRMNPPMWLIAPPKAAIYRLGKEMK